MSKPVNSTRLKASFSCQMQKYGTDENLDRNQIYQQFSAKSTKYDKPSSSHDSSLKSDCYQPVNYSYNSVSAPSSLQNMSATSGYRYIHSLGKGAYGKVELYEDTINNELVAIKHITKHLIRTSRQLDRVRREIRILSLLDHPHIIQLKKVIETDTSILMILEYVPHGELLEFISKRGKLTNMESLVIFRQLVSALIYCHSNCIIHRDLKPENILLSQDLTVKVADFGFGSVFGHIPLLSTFCGSPNYASPEMIEGLPYIGPEIDIWSLGVVLYVLLTGTLPKFAEKSHELLPCVQGNTNITPESFDLIQRMLVVDPTQRATLSQIVTHPWTLSVDSDQPPSYLPYREPITEHNLNNDILGYLCQSGYKKTDIYDILVSPSAHPLKSEYYLLSEKAEKQLRPPLKQYPSFIKRRSLSLGSQYQVSQHRSFSPVRKIIGRVSSFFTSSPSSTVTPVEKSNQNLQVQKPLSLIPTTERYRRSSLPHLVTTPEQTTKESKLAAFRGFSLNSPRRVVQNSSLVSLPGFNIPTISAGVISFLNEANILYSIRDSSNLFKLWCENQHITTDLPLLAFTIEVVEISSLDHECPTLYGLECRRICGGSWVIFRRLLTMLNKSLSTWVHNDQGSLLEAL